MEVLINSSTNITVQWGPVESCSRNITGYSVRYGEVGTSERTVVEMVSGHSSGGMTTISGLTKETVYTVEVAAKNSAGTGVYSDPLIFKTPDSEPNLHKSTCSIYHKVWYTNEILAADITIKHSPSTNSMFTTELHVCKQQHTLPTNFPCFSQYHKLP